MGVGPPQAVGDFGAPTHAGRRGLHRFAEAGAGLVGGEQPIPDHGDRHDERSEGDNPAKGSHGAPGYAR